jgi:hypothetical protein
MSITFEFKDSGDVLAKAKREQVRLVDALASQDRVQIADAIFNFAVTAYHIKDWLKKSPGAAYSGVDVENHIASDPYLRACREICNASKHRLLRSPPVDTVAVSASATSIVSPYLGESADVALETETAPRFRVKVVSLDGTRVEAGEFASRVLAAWEQFFLNHGLK